MLEGEREEHQIKLNKQCTDSVLSLITLICQNIECIDAVINRIDLNRMRLYSKDGVELTDNDVYFLCEGDIVYLDLLGDSFNFAQILDQYVRVAQLGLSGKVYKLKEKATGKFSVIKFIDFAPQDENFAEAAKHTHSSITETASSVKIDEFWRQVEVLKQLSHRNVLR